MLFCKETLGKPQNKPEKSLSTVCLETPQCPLQRAGSSGRKRKVCLSLLKPLLTLLLFSSAVPVVDYSVNPVHIHL